MAEWRTRVELAAFFRIVHANRWDDHIFTHLSARVPGELNHMLLAPLGMLFSEVTASSFIKTDLMSNKIDDDTPVNLGAVIIHGGVYEARPKISHAVHLHTRDNAVVSAQKKGLLPISQAAMLVHG